MDSTLAVDAQHLQALLEKRKTELQAQQQKHAALQQELAVEESKQVKQHTQFLQINTPSPDTSFTASCWWFVLLLLCLHGSMMLDAFLGCALRS